jgi:4-hydroxybenzoate polyprenyltransferase
MSVFWIVLLSQLAGQPYDPTASIILGLVTWAVYAADHAGGSAEDLMNNPGRAWLAKYPVKKLAAPAYLLAIIIVAWWDASKLPCVLVVGLAGAAYTTRIRGIRPKDILGMKTLIVASSTAICRAGLVGGAWWLYVLVLLVMVIDTILCDMRDIKGDTVNGVRTIPVILGRSRTLMLLAIIDIFIFTLSPILAAIGLCLIIYFGKERPSLAYDFLVDGWILWGAILIFPSQPFF